MGMNILDGLSGMAKRALTNTRDWNQGTLLPESVDRLTRVELTAMGMIGANGGLTRKGSIAAEKLQRAELDRLMPL
jgi:hypothetical protein